VRRHVAFLVGYLVVVIYLVEKLAVLLDHGLEKLGAPPAFGALVVAALVLAPKAWAASRPRSRTGCSGPSTSCWGRCSRRSRSPSRGGDHRAHPPHHVILGLDSIEQSMLLLTLFVSTITYTSGRTNVLQGAVHIMLLLAFLMFIIWH
jgi:Ca2+:H+ antiporter